MTSNRFEIANILRRKRRLATQLKRFSFPAVAIQLAALLIRAEYHIATDRIEELIHIAALVCCGNRQPTARHLKNWLNCNVQKNSISISGIFVPFEDVFVSNVISSFGNVRLFNGTWQNNSDYVQVCIFALNNLASEPWAHEALKKVTSLLQISDAIADRAGVSRNQNSNVVVANEIKVSDSTVVQANEQLSFSLEELISIGVNPQDLDSFVFQAEHADSLLDQAIGHSTLERQPLVRFEGKTIAALPTAIGATIRRYTVECASEAGQLQKFESEYLRIQYAELLQFGRTGWEIEFVEELTHESDSELREYVGRFDCGGYAYFLVLPDSFEQFNQTGITGIHQLETGIADRIQERVLSLSNNSDFQRGLTILIHGGIGRIFSPISVELPSGWHPICLTQPDFMLLGSKDGFSALRAWKLLQQVEDLEEKGVAFVNERGFMNLIAVSYYGEFELIPKDFSSGGIYLNNDFLLSLRIEIRMSRDKHASISPDGKTWLTVECLNSNEFISDRPELRVFTSVQNMIDHEYLACVETPARPWWIRCKNWTKSKWHCDIISQVLQMGLGWLGRAAPLLENLIFTNDQSEPITFQFEFPNIENFDRVAKFNDDIPSVPKVSIQNRIVIVECNPEYLMGFMRADNLNDRYLVAAFVRGVCLLYERTAVSCNEIEKIVQTSVGSENARFFQMFPCKMPEDLIFDESPLPPSRLLMPEDRAWSRFNLASRAGYELTSGDISSSETSQILEKAVDCIWERVRARLRKLSRESVIESSILNYIAIQKEHRDWFRTSAAQLALYDNSRVMGVLIYQESRRDITGLACRIVTEMALCTSPYRSASHCTHVDLDFLIAEVATLLECANYRDASNYGLVANPLFVHANGSFAFDESTTSIVNSFLSERTKYKFVDAAIGQGEELEELFDTEVLDCEFETAFIAEFGLSIEQYVEFIQQLTSETVNSHGSYLYVRKDALVQRLEKIDIVNTRQFLESFVLTPRARWDEEQPYRANKKDWYPWRYNRRLSLLRRPIVQLSSEGNPFLLLVPSLIARTLGYLGMAQLGRLPAELFDSSEMTTFIGRASDLIGHNFNRKVAEKFNDLNLKAKLEVSLTEIGGTVELGDIDVLAWNPDYGLVYVVECKCLRFDRTCGEIGERLTQYADGTVKGKRTQLQKHLDRVEYLKSNLVWLSNFTNIQASRLRIRSALVTESITPMKYSDKLRYKIDTVSDYGELEEVFGKL